MNGEDFLDFIKSFLDIQERLSRGQKSQAEREIGGLGERAASTACSSVFWCSFQSGLNLMGSQAGQACPHSPPEQPIFFN